MIRLAMDIAACAIGVAVVVTAAYSLSPDDWDALLAAGDIVPAGQEPPDFWLRGEPYRWAWRVTPAPQSPTNG